jgi:hypothetical protein
MNRTEIVITSTITKYLTSDRQAFFSRPVLTDDFSSGTSSRSTKLIHGGVRLVSSTPCDVYPGSEISLPDSGSRVEKILIKEFKYI